jgi:hypothetical protein
MSACGWFEPLPTDPIFTDLVYIQAIDQSVTPNVPLCGLLNTAGKPVYFLDDATRTSYFNDWDVDAQVGTKVGIEFGTLEKGAKKVRIETTMKEWTLDPTKVDHSIFGWSGFMAAMPLGGVDYNDDKSTDKMNVYTFTFEDADGVVTELCEVSWPKEKVVGFTWIPFLQTTVQGYSGDVTVKKLVDLFAPFNFLRFTDIWAVVKVVGNNYGATTPRYTGFKLTFAAPTNKDLVTLAKQEIKLPDAWLNGDMMQIDLPQVIELENYAGVMYEVDITEWDLLLPFNDAVVVESAPGVFHLRFSINVNGSIRLTAKTESKDPTSEEAEGTATARVTIPL